MKNSERIRDERFLAAYEKADEAGIELPEMTNLRFDEYRDLVEPLLEEHGFLAPRPILKIYSSEDT